MDLRDYLRILHRNWLIIIAVTLGGLLVAGTASVLVKPTYTSETQLFVAIQGSGSVSELQQGNTFSQARVQSYVKTVGTPVVLQPVIDRLGLNTTAEELAKRVKSSTDLNTVLININVVDNSPVQAAAIAQGVANSLVDAVESLEKPKSGGASPVGLSIIKPAQVPATPSAPNTKLNLIVGLVVGLVLGVGIAMARSLLDNRIRGEADLRSVTAAPLLGGIAFEPEASKIPLVTSSAVQTPRAESFRQLRTNLQFANVSGRARTVLVTSSVPGEGKSTTAINLALAMAQSGHSVCLVDADLRRPSVSDYLGVDRNAGLTTALIGQAELDDLLQPWGEDQLHVLTSGQIPPNPSELLGSAEMEQVLTQLESIYDFVVIDAPPLLPVTDAAVLSRNVGGVVVVVGAQRVRQPELERSLKALELVDANLLGIVLNRIPTKGPDAYAYSYYYESAESGSTIPESRSVARDKTRKALVQAANGETRSARLNRTQAGAAENEASSIFPRRRVEMLNRE